MRSTAIGKFVITLDRGCDLVHGKAWFAWASINEPHIRIITGSYRHEFKHADRKDRSAAYECGFGFHKKNKFTAVRNAIRDLYARGIGPQ